MVIVASLIVDQTFGLLRVEVATSRFGGNSTGQTEFQKFESQANGARDQLLDQTAKSVALAVEDGWKQKNIFERGVEQRIVVQVPIDNLGEWLSVRERLNSIAAVKELHVLQLSVDRAEVELAYLGSADQLRLAMAQSELDLSYAADKAVWTLLSGSGR